MSSFLTATAPSMPPARRRRAIVWSAAGLSFALHGLVAWLAWRGAHAPQEPPPPARRDTFFVDLLAPALPAAPARAPVPPAAGPAPSVDTPAASRPAGPRARPGATARQAGSSAPAASAPAPSSAPARDFRWRAEDAAAQGTPHARGEPRVKLAPRVAAEPSALAKGIAQSARPPCRQAHAHLGLLAAPLLLADALRDDGCKW